MVSVQIPMLPFARLPPPQVSLDWPFSFRAELSGATTSASTASALCPGAGSPSPLPHSYRGDAASVGTSGAPFLPLPRTLQHDASCVSLGFDSNRGNAANVGTRSAPFLPLPRTLQHDASCVSLGFGSPVPYPQPPLFPRDLWGFGSSSSSSSSSAGNCYATASASTASTPTPQPAMRPVLFVALQHGLGSFTDSLDNVRNLIEKEWCDQPHGDLVLWSSECNHDKTHDGLERCGERLATEMLTELTKYSGREIRVTLVGYSMGGLLMRHVARQLYFQDEVKLVLDCFVSLATPHCGVRQLGRKEGHKSGVKEAAVNQVMRLGARAVAGRTGRDLLLDTHALDRLADEEHCEALAAFCRRVAYANTEEDWLVPVHTASLLDAKEAEAAIRTAKNFDRPWRKVVKPFSKSWEEHGMPATRKVHSTYNDRGQAKRCCSMLKALRRVGAWDVYLVNLAEYGPPHSTIVAGYWDEEELEGGGGTAVRHVSGMLCDHWVEALGKAQWQLA